MPETEVGSITDFFARPVVAGVQLTAPLKVGDAVHIKGATTDLKLVVESMQLDNKAVTQGSAGQAVGIKVTDRVRRGDRVYRVEA